MPNITLPENQRRKWKTDYLNSFNLDIVESFGIELSTNEGVRLSWPFAPHTVSGLDSEAYDFSVNNADGALRVWASVENGMFQASLVGVLWEAFQADTITDSPSQPRGDVVVMTRNPHGYDVMIVQTGPNDLAKLERLGTGSATWTLNWWTDGAHLDQDALNSSYPIVLKSFNNLLLIGNDNILRIVERLGDNDYQVIQSTHNGNVLPYELAIDNRYYIAWIVTTKEKIFLGAHPKASRQAEVLSTVVEYDYFSKRSRSIECTGGLNIGFSYQNALCIVTESGYVMQYTGTGWETVASFPVVSGSRELALPFRNGISVVRQSAFMALPQAAYWQAGGVWEVNIAEGTCYHRYSVNCDTTQVRQFGQHLTGDLGALAHIASPSEARYFLLGASMANRLGAVSEHTSGIFANYSGPATSTAVFNEHEGYFVTGRIPTHGTQDSQWKRLLLKYTPYSFNLSTLHDSEIVAKYRTEGLRYSGSGTWQTNTTLEMAASVIDPAEIGDEIFFTLGDGAGGAAHITDIDDSVDPRIVTLDRAIVPNPEGECTFFISKWRRLEPTVDDQNRNFTQIDLPDTLVSDWVQFKFEFRKTSSRSFELNQVQVGFQPNLKLE